MASKFLERLRQGPVLGDGGYYLELERRCLGSLAKGVPWAVLDYPEGLLELHREFARAGAEVLQAMTWGVKEFDREEELHHTAVRLAREAAGPARFVAGTLNPCLMIYPSQSPASNEDQFKAQKFFEKRVGQQAAAGVDLFIVETFYSVFEVGLVLPLIQEAGLPAVVTLTFREQGHTLDGLTPAEAAKRLVDIGADVVGSNCARPWATMRPIVQDIRNAVSASVCSQPNGYQLEPGETYNERFGGRAISARFQPREETRFAMADYAREARAMGVSLIGACCGALPYHIRAMAEALGKPTEIPDRSWS